MLYIKPTKKGIEAEIWGTYEDLDYLYEVICKFWNQEQYHSAKGFENRDKLISGFSYEIRKALWWTATVYFGRDKKILENRKSIKKRTMLKKRKEHQIQKLKL